MRTPLSATGMVRCPSCKTSLPWIVDADDADLIAALATAQLVLLDLWAPWYAPCRTVAPALERLAARHAGQLKVVKVNVDRNPLAAARFDARSIPTLVLLRAGAPVGRIVGSQPEPVLRAEVEQHLAR